MRLRSISKHLSDQNWAAVFLDFLIVILGVYIGVQMGNLNDRRKDRQDYQEALARYKQELQDNLKALEQLDRESQRALQRGSQALDALLSCEDSPENIEAVNSGLIVIGGTYGIRLHRTAFDELTSSEKLLAEQSLEIRQRLSQAKYYFDLALYEASFVETFPLEERMENNPIIGVGQMVQGDVTYAGADFSRKQRLLTLKVPISEACKNDPLIKSFYVWERWQIVLPTLSNILRQEMEKTLEVL